jgi:hypothetical protein
MAGEIALLSREPNATRQKPISSVRSQSRSIGKKGPGNCARRRVCRVPGTVTVSGKRPAIFSPRSTAGSPRASTRSI